jgi:hypothetical protein
MRYWIYSAGEIEGPAELEKLGEQPGFGPASLVCPENSSGEAGGDWKLAASIPELAPLLENLKKNGLPRASAPDEPGTPPANADEEINAFLKNFGFSQEDIELAANYGGDIPPETPPTATTSEGDEQWLARESDGELAGTGAKIQSSFSTLDRLRRAARLNPPKPPRLLGEAEPPWIKDMELNEKIQHVAAESARFAVGEEDEGEESPDLQREEDTHIQHRHHAESPAFAENPRNIESAAEYADSPQQEQFQRQQFPQQEQYRQQEQFPQEEAPIQPPQDGYYDQEQQPQRYTSQSPEQDLSQEAIPPIEEEILAPPNENAVDDLSAMLQEPAPQPFAAAPELEGELVPPPQEQAENPPQEDAPANAEAAPPLRVREEKQAVQQQPQPKAEQPAPSKKQQEAAKYTVINQFPIEAQETPARQQAKPEPAGKEEQQPPAAKPPAAHIDEIKVAAAPSSVETGPQSLLSPEAIPEAAGQQSPRQQPHAQEQQVPLAAQQQMQAQVAAAAAKATSASYTIQVGSNMPDGINMVATGGNETVTVADIAANAPPVDNKAESKDPQAIISGGIKASDPHKATFNAAAMLDAARATVSQTKRTDKRKTHAPLIFAAAAAAMIIVGIAGAYLVLRQDGVGISSLFHGGKNKNRNVPEKIAFKDTSGVLASTETASVTTVAPAQNPAKSEVAPSTAVPAGISPTAALSQNQQTDTAISIVKNHQLDNGRGTIANWLKNSYTAKNGIEDWVGAKLNGNSYMVQYRFLRPRQEPITYIFAVDVKAGTITRGINDPALELLGGIAGAGKTAKQNASVQVQPAAAAPAGQTANQQQTAKNPPTAAAPSSVPQAATAQQQVQASQDVTVKPAKPVRKKKVKSKTIQQLPLPDDPTPASPKKSLSIPDDTDL